MSWFYLSLAIVLEISGTTCMKLSEGFTRILPSVLIFVFYALSFALLTLTLKKLELGLVYAIWAGVGTALIAAIGIVAFNESFNTIKIISIGLICIGVIGLNLTGAAH